MKRGLDGEVIPGGRAFATHVAHRLVVFQKLHYERVRAKLERQRKALQADFERKKNQNPYQKQSTDPQSEPCRGCWFVLHRSELETCQGNGAHGKFCADCRHDGMCTKECALRCDAPGCQNWVVGTSQPCALCIVCDSVVCAQHLQYCRYCGTELCEIQHEGWTATCEQKHSCPRKRSKQEEKSSK